MNTITTGFPKHGNHALVKAAQLLGIPCDVQHLEYSEHWSLWPAPRVVIKRDPRDALVSWVRHNGQPVTPGMVMRYMREFEDGKTLTEAMAPFEGWLTDPTALVVRYEDLTASDAAMRRIAAHCGVEYVDDAWRWLPGMTRTWNAQRSDHAAVWTPQVGRAWQDVGGPQLLERWGY